MLHAARSQGEESHWCLREQAPRTETSIEANPRWCHRFEMRSLDEETVLAMDMALPLTLVSNAGCVFKESAFSRSVYSLSH